MPAPRRPLSVIGVLRRRCPGVFAWEEAGVPVRLPLPNPSAKSRLPKSGEACLTASVFDLPCFWSLSSASPSAPSVRAPMKSSAVSVVPAPPGAKLLRGDREHIPAKTDGFRLWLRPVPGRPPRVCPGKLPTGEPSGLPRGDRGVT